MQQIRRESFKMKKINLNLKNRFTPKQIKILAAVAGSFCIVLVIGVIWLCQDKEEAFTPAKYVIEKVKPEITLSVEEDKTKNKGYGAPVSIYETKTDIKVGKE